MKKSKKGPTGTGGNGPIGGGGPSKAILTEIAKELKNLGKLFSDLSKVPIGGTKRPAGGG